MHQVAKLRRITVLAGCVLLAGLAGTVRPLYAQAIFGSLFGTVTDSSGARLPGVVVTVASPQSIAGQESRVTDNQGLYRFPQLRPGTYTVRFELSGFSTVTREGIVLPAGQSIPVDAQMSVAGLSESVTVNTQALLIDTRNSALVNVQDQAILQNIPAKRDFTQMLNIMPGVTDGHYDFAPVNNVHGSTLRQSVYSLDGVSTDDPYSSTTTVMLPPDAFQEVQVTTAGITAEFGDASGAVFNVITKSGGDQFHGGASAYLQNATLQSNNTSASLAAQGVTTGTGVDHRYDLSGLLGGPVFTHHLWFFDNYRYLNENDRISSFSAPLTNRDHMNFLKVTGQVSKDNSFDFGFYYRNYSNFPYTSIASYTNSGDPRVWEAIEKKNSILMPRWTTVIGNNTLLDIRGSSSYFRLTPSDPNNVGAPNYIDMATGIISGGDDQTYDQNIRNRHEIKGDVTHFTPKLLRGSHNFKVGVAAGYDPVSQERFVLGARGANELLGCSQQCVSALPDTQLLLYNGAPYRVRFYNSPTLQRVEDKHVNAYAEDQWVVDDRVTLNIGVRLEHESGTLFESYEGPGQYVPTEIVFPAQNVINFTTVAPRLGGVWDVKGDHSTTIKLSGGRFYNQLNATYSMVASPDNLGYREYDWIDANHDLLYEPGELGTLRTNTVPNPALAATIDPNLKDQYTDVYTVSFERSLGHALSISVTGLHKRDGNLFGTINAAVPFSDYVPITVTNPLTSQPMTIYTLPSQFQAVAARTVLTNPNSPVPLTRKYDGLEIVVRRRLEGKWQFESSYVYGNARGNVGNAYSDSSTATYTNPNTLINRYGALPNSPRHQFKMLGTWMAPWDVSVSAYFEVLSGLPWTENMFGSSTVKGAETFRFLRSAYPQIQSETYIDVAVEPAGTRLMDTTSHLDLRVEKRFRVRGSTFAGMLDVFNIFNASAVTRIKTMNMSDPINFGVPAQIQYPRQVRIGIKWTF
jgi:outer membrane receptor protein involved in Fe transport